MKRSSFRPALPSRLVRPGFTLLEVLIVLGIIGVIAAIAVPRLLAQGQTAKIKSTLLAVKNAEQAVSLYAANNGLEPPSGGDEVWQTLIQKGPKGEPATLDKIPIDAWNKQLHYAYPNKKAAVETDRPAIWSDGPTSDPGDDVNNWDDLVQQPQ